MLMATLMPIASHWRHQNVLKSLFVARRAFLLIAQVRSKNLKRKQRLIDLKLLNFFVNYEVVFEPILPVPFWRRLWHFPCSRWIVFSDWPPDIEYLTLLVAIQSDLPNKQVRLIIEHEIASILPLALHGLAQLDASAEVIFGQCLLPLFEFLDML